MTGVIVGGTLKSLRSTLYGGAGSILVETRRNGVAEGPHKVLLLLKSERVSVDSHLTDETTGQHTFSNLITTADYFTVIAYDASGATPGAVQTDVTAAASPSATVLDFAGVGGAGTNTITVSVVLVDRDDAPRASLTGLRWVFFDQAQPNLFSAVAASGSGETTDVDGNFSVTITTSVLSAGDTGFLIVSNTDGVATNDSNAFAGPVLVT